MKRKVEEWTVEDIYEVRNKITVTDFQRNPHLWTTLDKQLLIDSILVDIDIPKLYFYESGNAYEVIDGQQRLWAIWEFIDNEYPYKAASEKALKEFEGKKFDDLPKRIRNQILSYKLQVVLISDVSDEYLRKLFLRLQLGLLLVSGEKLKAAAGRMRDFVFKRMAKHPFIESVSIPIRRYAKQTLCAQICINSFSRMKAHQFSRTRYEDLLYFFEHYKDVKGSESDTFKERCEHIINVLALLNKYFGAKANVLRNRSLILSVYLFVEELFENRKTTIDKVIPELVRFILKLIKRLKEEALAGFNRKNEELYKFESYLNNAPGEKYQIENRHRKLIEFFNYYQEKGEIKGD